MNSIPGLSLYNQDRLDDESFVDGFVARAGVLDTILSQLREQARGGANEHLILVGSRGMGKTSLLRRIAIGVNRDEVLASAFAPLRFREEQYNVISLDAFWRNCGEALAEWLEKAGREAEADRLDRQMEDPDWRDPDASANAFLDTCRKIGRRPLLLLDNLDLILDALKEKESWQLRQVLQRPAGPVVIGAATQHLQQTGQRDAPFYEFFHPYVLEPLKEKDLLACMHALADRRGDLGAPVRMVLAQEPERIRTLYALTGGNPRVLALIYQVLERSETDTIFADLEALLDQVTPFYKARVEEYSSPQQRAVIDAVALNWDPIGSGALAAATGIEVTTISSQLNRLRRDGFVEEVESSGARSGYQLAERFLNIWYLMRHGTRRTRHRLRWLTLFLARLYTSEELGRMATCSDRRDPAQDWHPDFRYAVDEARRELQREGALPKLRPAIAEAEFAQPDATGSELDASLRMAFELFNAGRFEHAIAVCDEVVSRFGTSSEPALLENVAMALVNKGVTLSRLRRLEDEIAVYDEVVSRFGESLRPALLESVARALVNKGGTLGELGRGEDAIAVCDDVVSRFGTSLEPALLENVARALVNKGGTLSALGRPEDEIAVYDDVVSRFGQSSQPALLESVARALVNKGGTFDKLGRGEDAIAVCDEVVSRFGESSEPALLAQVALALFNKGIGLGGLGRRDDAIAVYDDVVSRFGASSELELLESVARALVNKGGTLSDLGRRDDAIAVYGDVVSRFGTSSEPALLERVARAMVNKGVTLNRLGRSEEAIAVYDDVVSRFGASSEPALLEQVAKALVNNGVTLSRLGRSEEAIAIYGEVVSRFGASSEPVLLERVAKALVNKGSRLGALGRNEDAIAVYDDVVSRFGGSQETALLESVARARVNKGTRLGALGRGEDAIAVYDDVVSRFGASSGSALLQQVARALWNKGITLGALGRSEDAVAACDDIISRFGASSEAALLEHVAKALARKGSLLFDDAGLLDEAEAAYRRSIDIGGETMLARANLSWLLLAKGETDGANQLLAGLTTLESVGLDLLMAGIELVSDNLGNAFSNLGKALGGELDSGGWDFFDDLLRFFRIAKARGHGEATILWFEESGNADRYAPAYAALVAYVRGEAFLHDFNPEVRPAATGIFQRLTRPDRDKGRPEQGRSRKPRSRRNG